MTQLIESPDSPGGLIPPIEYEQEHYRQTAALTEDNAAFASLH